MMRRKRKIVTLCGSTRFKKEFEEAAFSEGQQGHIVLSVTCFGHADNIEHTDKQKHDLDALHLDKILMSDEIFVVNPGGYVGKSTAREVVFAIFHHKVIRWREPEAGERWLEDNAHELGGIFADFITERLNA